MSYLQNLVLITFLCVTFAGCSQNSSPEQTAQARATKRAKRTAYIHLLDKIPQRVQELDSVSVFKGNVKSNYSVNLVPEQTFGKQGKPYLTEVYGCIVDNKDRVIINDFDKKKAYGFPNVLYAYNADGSYRTQIGGPGKGPGEYGFIMNVQAKTSKVIVFDFINKRLNIYNTNNYTLKRTILLEHFKNTNDEAARGFEFGYAWARSDGNYLVSLHKPKSSPGRTESKYLLMDRKGHVLDYKSNNFSSSLKIKNSSPTSFPSAPLYFMGETKRALSNDDAMYWAWSQDFLIKKYDSRGHYQSAIYYSVQGSPFDLSDYTEKANYNRNDVINTLDEAGEELPVANPVIADLKVDDENRIWVAIPTGVKSDYYEWWILKESGKLLGKLTLPRDKKIYAIKNGNLYSKKTNKETGAEYVVKYRIAMTKK